MCLLPPNTTDLLQPMDLTVNKPAKSFLKNAFSQWYADQLLQQLEDHDVPLDQIELDVIDLGLPVLKELGAKWLVMMAQYIEDNPQFIVNGFIKAGISGALDDGISDSSGESALDSDELPECSDVSNSSEASDSDNNTSCDSEDHLGSLEVEENGKRIHTSYRRYGSGGDITLINIADISTKTSYPVQLANIVIVIIIETCLYLKRLFNMNKGYL